MNPEQNINLIKCSNDGWAPWSVVCVHLAFENGTEWIPLDSNNPEVDHDWLCPECADIMDGLDETDWPQDYMDKLRPICIHCVREIRRKNDRNFSEDE